METRWGKRLGRYEIVSELGCGTMGAVYKARDPKIDRFVAIKTISLARVENAKEFRERFFHEAQAAGRLLHPGIVTIFDVAEEPESRDPYIVMEYVPGPNLEQMLTARKRKLPLPDALQLTEAIAEALDCAHAQGIVHRDIKPANILMTEEGHPKIADFGVARIDAPNLTSPGLVLGTPAYMSPEQLEGEAVDGRSDLFSLAVILYRMVTGYGPFQGGSFTTVCFKIANREPMAASLLNAEVPPQLDSVLARGMAKEPRDRYQRGMEFALDLRELRERLTAVKDLKTSDYVFQGAPDLAATGTHGHRRMNLASILSSPSEIWAAIRSYDRQKMLVWSRRRSLQAAVVLAASAIFIGVPAFYAGRLHLQVNPPAQTAAPAIAVVPEQAGTTKESLPVPNSIPTVKVTSDSALQIRVKHQLSAGSISVWVDNNLAYSSALRNQPRKKLIFFRGGGTDSVTIPLAHGDHLIRVRVRAGAEKYDQTNSIRGSFAASDVKLLQVDCDKKSGTMRVALQKAH